MKLLHIKVSPNVVDSASRQVAGKVLDKLQRHYPTISESVLDLAQHPLPHLDALTVAAFMTKPEQRSMLQQQAIAQSDFLVDQLLAHDLLLISSPMWNLGLPSVLKAWFDHITRAGRTFTFNEAGEKIGLVTNKRVFVVMANGTPLLGRPTESDDQFTPYMTTALRYIGITDVQFIRVDGTHHPQTKAVAIPEALAAIDFLRL
ncbi:FMN-dependent NADH-azoreductase [Idiomarina xiamenensis]|uniref:FMN dependent NADH:quinone oxidoreductase n=1 Tax=Idiomarina xiamenensis 10-D-4 TaxID=740709 RepID=K2KPK8_9GAMM|nr:NAD(P)H-dependent oxidoreductase [Idiomarina xiamenensis]EKE84379.1 acyl carrier protein phosphodiesterase [Idiomarina xiamenensis 10-D-4]